MALAAALVLFGLAAFDLARLALEARAKVDSIGEVRWNVDRAVADAAELRDGSDTLESAAARLSAIERRLDRYGPVLAIASVIPPLGRRIEEAQALLTIHVDLSSAAAESLEIAAGLLDRLTGTGDSPGEPLRALVETLETKRETIRDQLAIVERASRRLDAIATTAGGQLGDPRTEALRDSIETLHTALQAALLAPDALGSPTPARYLLLAQKSDELRPTGGFIGNVAFVTLVEGEARDLTYLRSYLVEDPTRPRVPAPPPFRRYQGMRDWNLRDANWHPDFRRSADEIQRFLALNGVEPVDGVLAFDQQALGILLAAIGRVEVPGHDVRVSSANAYTVLEHFAHSTGDRRAWFSARPFYAALTSALLEVTTERLRTDPRSVIGALQAMVAEKHLMAAFRNTDLQRLVERGGSGGRLAAVPDDLLYVVDAQVDHGAPFRSIEQTVRYHPDPRTGRATLTIYYVNRNSPADPNGRLADYLRVYVPAGTRLASVSGLTDARPARQVNGLTEFAGFLDLPPGGQRQVRFLYWLPPLLAARWSATGYALSVPKQPGTDGHRLTVETPQGVVFDGRLTTDLVIRETAS
ncbi:MAG: DUF4012 domain-containing protein [Chloroflexota bacterium]|nr:DUF4012 domain-containing protein [Chloroflexota bacterium]MDE2920486.1 DUF4012 domain-containing protein [Chloroflexota bacterium]